ncbi:MAG: iron-containing alcohol dehydrogenase [Ruminococcaceae bacterium]|jgi:alcohol dehydrogenase|nr:iron-containing alcohol dehydrogenase [Oscillospiraceae bacterium]
MNWDFLLPVKLYFGSGRINELSKIIDEKGFKRGVLVCDGIFAQNGLADEIVKKSGGKLTAVFSDITPNPTTENVNNCVKLLRQENAEFVVALGGGSSMDCAKAACAIKNSDDLIDDYHSGIKKLNADDKIPMIAVPTTAGTGSEVTFVSVLTNEQKGLKAPLGNPLLYAEAAIIDPELTLSVPQRVTASTGLDVLSHALEGYWSIYHQPVCDAVALSAARTVFEYLPVVYDNPSDLNAREKMCEASLLAGIGFSYPKTTGSHACSFPLTNIYHVPHGEACAFTLDYFLRLNASKETDGRIDRFVKDCGFENAEKAADRILEMKKAFGMRCTLSEIGVKDEEIRALSEKSMHPNMLNNPVKMTVESVEEMYRSLR